MKNKITLTPSRYFQDAKQSTYDNPKTISSLEEFKSIISHDYACAIYKSNHRSISDFQKADAVCFDIDNDHSESPKDWITPNDVSRFFYGVEMFIQFSRNHMKEKDGKSSRPKFHIIMPIDEITDATKYRALKEYVHSIYPYVDKCALDAARLLYGTSDSNAIEIKGNKNLTDFIKEYDKTKITEGSRNNEMHKIAVSLLKKYGNTKESREKYKVESFRCVPRLESNELNQIWKSALGFYSNTIETSSTYIKPEDYKKSSFDEIVPLDDIKLPSFPIDALPLSIRNYCLDVAEVTQTPIDMAGVSALAILALSMQSNFKVETKPDWNEQISLYCMIVANPSDRKSAVLSQMIKVIQAFEINYNDSHDVELQKNKLEWNGLITKRNKLIKDLEKGKASQSDLDNCLKEIHNFKHKNKLTLLVDDVTPESLSCIMQEQNGSLAIVSSEGGLIDIISGAYSKTVNIDILLKGYSGDLVKINRIGRDEVTIHNPKLTILLMVQPKVLDSFVSNDVFSGRGLTSRFLYSFPKSLVGSRKFDTEEMHIESKQEFDNVVKSILNQKDEPMKYIKLTDAATDSLREFYNRHEKRLKNELNGIGDWAGKLCGNIARIAGIITRVKGIKYDEFDKITPSTDELSKWIIQKEDMDNAIKICEYFLIHGEYAFNEMNPNQQLRDAKKILKFLKDTKPTEISVRETMRKVRIFDTSERCKSAIELLADYNYLKRIEITTSSKGKPKGSRYLVNPKTYDDESS